MLKALICLFAVYGLGCFVYFNVRARLHSRLPSLSDTPDPDEVILQVHDAEERIEGLVREFVKTELHSSKPRRLTVVDTGSQDQTKDILERLVYRYPYLSIQSCSNPNDVPASKV